MIAVDYDHFNYSAVSQIILCPLSHLCPEILFEPPGSPKRLSASSKYVILVWDLYLLKFQELKKLGLGPNVDLHVTEVPVEYRAVQNLLPSLWELYHPQVVLLIICDLSSAF